MGASPCPARRSLAVLLLLVAIARGSRFEFLISQKGAEQVGKFAVQQGLNQLEKAPLTVHVSTKAEPQLGPLATARASNLFSAENASVLMQESALGIRLIALRFQSVIDFQTQLWPTFVGEERLSVNFSVAETFLSIDTNSNGSRDGDSRQKFILKECLSLSPRLVLSAKNYWLLDAALQLGAGYLESQFDSVVCPEIAKLLEAAGEAAEGSVQFDSLDLPVGSVQNVSLLYNLLILRVDDGHASLALVINWQTAATDDQPFPASPTNSTVQLELSAANGHHVTLWVHDDILNDFFELFGWDLLFLHEQIPVNDSNIPESSRQVLTTLCIECFFVLKVWNDGAPKLLSQNASTTFKLNERVRLWVVNPTRNQSAIFIAFQLFIHGLVKPYVENGTLKVQLDLINANVTMDEGAVPPDWAFFMQDLIRGMIMNMVWPTIKENVESLTKDVGIRVPASCGLDPQSAVIRIEEGRLGVGTDLRLSDFVFEQCLADLKTALPRKPPAAAE